MQQVGKPGRKALLTLFIRKARIGAAQLQIRHQPIKTPGAAIHDDKSAFLYLLRRHGQPHLKVGLQTAAHHITDGWIDCVLRFRKVHQASYSNSARAFSTLARRT